MILNAKPRETFTWPQVVLLGALVILTFGLTVNLVVAAFKFSLLFVYAATAFQLIVWPFAVENTAKRAIKVAVFVPFYLLTVSAATFGYIEMHNHERATLKTVLVSMDHNIFASLKNTTVQSSWGYSYHTTVNGEECTWKINSDHLAEYVLVNYLPYKCEYGYREVTEAQWQKLNVGDVLKVVELK